MGKLLALVFPLFLATPWISGSNGEGRPKSHSEGDNQLEEWRELHANQSSPFALTANGIPYPSLTASQAIGRRGEILLQDMFLLEKHQSFNRERIPERVVHAKGAGAFGVFKVTHDISEYTKANFLNGIGKETKVAVRFSTVGGESGSGDTWVDPKGFATKFYTKEGIHDLVGNNIQVFPIRDPMLFPDINRARKRNPQTHLRDPTMWWDFTSLRPESTLHTLHLFSDQGTPKSFRFMDGAGVHTFKMVNASGHPVYVKFHWKSKQKPFQYFTPEESAANDNADLLLEDLFNNIHAKHYPSWDLFVQVMTFGQAEIHEQNPFDITTFWRQDEYPLIPVGTMTLNKNPDDYFSQVEQIAFSPSRMVPGIEPSPDRMLHARIFSYPDSQMYRLGVNFAQIPVNSCPFKVSTYQRDGAMNTKENGHGAPNYHPNSYHGLREAEKMEHSSFPVSGNVDRVDTGDEDNFSMARIYLGKDVSPDERQRIIHNIAHFLNKAAPRVQRNFLNNIAYKISKVFGDDLKSELDTFANH